MRSLGLLGGALGGSPPFAGLGTGIPDATKFLRGDGQWVAVSGGPVSLVGTYPLSGSSLDITGLASGYDYEVCLDGVYPSSIDYLSWRVQTGGSTWQTTGYYFGGWLTYSQNPDAILQSTSGVGANGLAYLFGNYYVDASSSSQLNGIIRVSNPAGGYASFKSAGSYISSAHASTSFISSAMNGSFRSSTVATGMRLFWTGGASFSGGTATVYKIARSP